MRPKCLIYYVLSFLNMSKIFSKTSIILQVSIHLILTFYVLHMVDTDVFLCRCSVSHGVLVEPIVPLPAKTANCGCTNLDPAHSLFEKERDQWGHAVLV